MDFLLFASQCTIHIVDDGMNLEQTHRPLVRIEKAQKSQGTYELLGLIGRSHFTGSIHQLSSDYTLCWEVVPVNIQTTGKGLWNRFVRSAMSVATYMCRFDSPFAHPT